VTTAPLHVRAAFFVFAAEKNTLGRAYALWLAAEELGWETRFVAPRIDDPWSPLVGEHGFVARLTADGDQAAAWADVLVALKPWPGALDVALRLGRVYDKPVAVDVDDPDWENEYGWSAARQALTFATLTCSGRRPLGAYRLRYTASRLERVLVSNPALQRWYRRGVVVPHARPARPPGRPHSATGTDIEVAFVGTVAEHKGVEVLREAAKAAGDVRLVLTAEAPPDARPNERWIGRTTLEEGLAVIDRCDVVAVPSQPWVYGAGQLPVKLIDAMIAGRAVVASDLGPARWALAGTGLLVPPGDAVALGDALKRLRSSSLRSELGQAARLRALQRFTPAAVAHDLAAGLGFGDPLEAS